MTSDITIAYLCSDVGVQVIGFRGCSVHVRDMCSALALFVEMFLSSLFQRSGAINIPI